MMTAHIIETYLPAMNLAMTAREKWGCATSGLNSSDFTIPTWFIISVGVVVIVVIASSVIVACKQKARKK
jgi:hypothetical protein